MKKIKEKNKKQIYLTHFTYRYLQSLLDIQCENELVKYNDAKDRIGNCHIDDQDSEYPIIRDFEPYDRDKLAANQIYESYLTRVNLINNMKQELTFAYSKSAHPNLIANKDFLPKYEYY